MTNYGKDGILDAANVLPATTGVGLLLLNNTNPAIVAALLFVNSVSLVFLVGAIVRFVINSVRNR